MLITLFRRSAFRQQVAEIGVVPLGATDLKKISVYQ